MSTRKSIFTAIERERDYQDSQHGTHDHTVAEWILIMEKKIQDAKEAWYTDGDIKALQEILKVASTGTAALEQHYLVERIIK